MTPTYEQARAEVEAALAARVANPFADGPVVVPAQTIRVLLAGRPEPSDEEVLGAWFNVEPERLSGPKHRSEIASVCRVQTLYRSRNDG